MEGNYSYNSWVFFSSLYDTLENTFWNALISNGKPCTYHSLITLAAASIQKNVDQNCKQRHKKASLELLYVGS